METLHRDGPKGRPVAILLARLPGVRRVASGWLARCPSHDDTHPSLSISEADEGAVLIFCHAGCPPEAIVSALGLTLAHLFPAQSDGRARVVATYDYRSADGGRFVQVVRFEPKGFRQRRWTGTGWTWGLGGLEPTLYRLPELIAADPSEFVAIVEGEKDADRLARSGFVATTNVGGAGKWRADYNEALRDRRVVILPDNDPPGRHHAIAVAASLKGFATSVAIVELQRLPAKGDVSDWLDAGGSVAELRRLIETADEPLAADATAVSTESSAGLAETLDAVAAHLARFIHFACPEDVDAIALWVAHTHVPLERLEQSPILALTSAVKRSGKSRVLDVLEHLVARPWRIIRPSEAVLFRKINRDHPTVLLDEIDTIFADKAGSTEAIRAIFDSGNRHGTKVPRTHGKTYELVEFDVFCPKATAGIGGLPDTILDRAIVITMERRAWGETLERLRARTARRLGTPLRDRLANLVLRIDDPSLPDEALPAELDERAQDGWEPLLAIAAAAGGDWPARARAAAVAIHARQATIDDSYPARLLADCRAVFGDARSAFLATADLLAGLVAIEGSPWGDLRGRSITARYLGHRLKAFGIEPSRERLAGGGNPVRGYRQADFVEAWRRYTAEPPSANGTSGTSGTARSAPAPLEPGVVPDVPLVPLPLALEADGTLPGWADDLAGDAAGSPVPPSRVDADEMTLWTE